MSGADSIALDEIMATKSGSVDPSKYPDEVFDLYSIPAFDRGEPEVVAGAEIGSAKQVVEPGDVLLSKIVPHIRRSWVVGANRGRRIIASGEWIVFRSDRVHAQYLRHVLVADPFHAQYMNTVSGVGGSLLRARPAHVARITIPLPSLPEQRRIAEILDKADALRAKRRAALAQLDTLTQSIFLDMFGDPATNPMRWPVSRVGAVAKQIRGVTYSKEEASKEPREGYLPILRAGNISDGEIQMDDLVFVPAERVAGEQLLRRNDVLIAASSGSLDVVGKAARVRDDLKAGFGAFCKALRPGSEVDPTFFAAFFRTRHYRLRISELAAGININNLRSEHLDNFPLPNPPTERQGVYATIAAAIASCRESHRDSLSLLDSLFASLQHRAFGGEL